ncbi:4-hydroxythreonine-4-phosphate dehydrogenase PdxA, partial [Micrococcus luteus]|nr:4-hydroxythreonine-4-phosphate dehydrogenase PdxA [Micrococcus luteus]
RLPILAVTLGDVAGIGPEVTAKMLLKHPHLRLKARFVVIGDVAALQKAAQQIGFDAAVVREVQSPTEIINAPDSIEVIQVGPSLAEVQLATVDARAGAAAAQFVIKACALARAGEVDGIVTAPLNKEAMHLGGYHWPG